MKAGAGPQRVDLRGEGGGTKGSSNWVLPSVALDKLGAVDHPGGVPISLELSQETVEEVMGLAKAAARRAGLTSDDPGYAAHVAHSISGIVEAAYALSGAHARRAYAPGQFAEYLAAEPRAPLEVRLASELAARLRADAMWATEADGITESDPEWSGAVHARTGGLVASALGHVYAAPASDHLPLQMQVSEDTARRIRSAAETAALYQREGQSRHDRVPPSEAQILGEILEAAYTELGSQAWRGDLAARMARTRTVTLAVRLEADFARSLLADAGERVLSEGHDTDSDAWLAAGTAHAEALLESAYDEWWFGHS